MQDENAICATLAQIIVGSVLLIGVYFTARNVQIAQQNLHATEEGKITDRFSKAIEQLGSEKLELRLGGIYALERVAGDSERDHWPVMEVLTAYIREHAPCQRHLGEKGKIPIETATAVHPQTDIQAILTVIGRRQRTFRHGEKQFLDLGAVDLRGANLSQSRLAYVNLIEADLTEAFLTRANLTGANLIVANLIVANLTGADLVDADLIGANLTGATFLAREYLQSVIIDETTQLPGPLQPPEPAKDSTTT